MDEPAVLDAGPVLAYLDDEPGSDAVQALFERGSVWMNLVNLGEVTYIVEREEGARKADEVFAELITEQPAVGRSALSWLPVDAALVRQAARVRAVGGLSYADAFAAASAQLLGGVLVACREDEEFQVAERLGVRVHWIG